MQRYSFYMYLLQPNSVKLQGETESTKERFYI